jgi:hypothetical protein
MVATLGHAGGKEPLEATLWLRGENKGLQMSNLRFGDPIRCPVEHNEVFMKTIIKLTLISIIVLSCFGCVTYIGYDGPYEGQIIDMETRKPLEGVVVQGGWSRVHFPMGGHSDVDFKEVLTDKNGNFKISGVGILIFSNIEEMDFCALKAGYSQVGYCYGPWSSLKQYEKSSGITVNLLSS